jgi:hypothetical protein
MKHQNITFKTILLALGFLALSSIARAVSPAPDGGYAGGNTAEGTNSLLGLTTGTYNTGIGLDSLLSLTDSKFCTGVGAATLLANKADENTAIGAGALLSNTTGFGNTANGAFALFSNTTGAGNTATGISALVSNVNGGDNTADGTFALLNNTGGNSNTAVGRDALLANVTGNENTAVGRSALGSNTGGGNTAVGFLALGNNTADANAALGWSALASNIDGTTNTAVGGNALVTNVSGNFNTAMGNAALFSNTGSANVALGYGAGADATNGDNNIYIGSQIRGLAGESNACRIGSIWEQTCAADSCFIMGVDQTNKLGTSAAGGVGIPLSALGDTRSSRRFKDDIQPMNNSSDAILALRPVTFRYKDDTKRLPRFGLIAEEVAGVDPDLVTLDKEGKPERVRYEAVNAMLLNEFLKEHRKVQELEKGMGSLTAQLKEQAAQIQKVSAQVEMSKSTTKVVLSNP